VDRPQTQYARSGELAIAYQAHGSGDHELLLCVGSTSNIGAMWDLPGGELLLERLGKFARVVCYDRRNSGLSDSVTEDLTLESHVADTLAVMDAAGLQRPVLFGSLDGARALTLLAATRPERVGGLIALSPTVRGAAASNPELASQGVDVVNVGVDLDNYPGEFGAFLAPGWRADPVRWDKLTRYLQACVTPGQTERLVRLMMTNDIGAVLPLIQTPTLVLHPRDQKFVPAEAVRGFTELVPDARFREMPGDAGIIFALDVGLLADMIEEFVTGRAPRPATNRVLATVLFTDLVDSTRRAAQSGDRAWSETIKRHLDQARTAVAAQGGETIETTGDGLLALFTGPGEGVRCAKQVIGDAGELGLEVRSGIHTGEVERGPDGVAGLAVHLAARIMALGGASEILVSSTVRDLVIGSELTFAQSGEHELKGVPGRWTIWAAT
jgi:class 3 adenylate cyclase/pimeloyl-ACP methyl ester carboxylesterase